jgi:hypothetical protein
MESGTGTGEQTKKSISETPIEIAACFVESVPVFQSW